MGPSCPLPSVPAQGSVCASLRVARSRRLVTPMSTPHTQGLRQDIPRQVPQDRRVPPAQDPSCRHPIPGPHDAAWHARDRPRLEAQPPARGSDGSPRRHPSRCWCVRLLSAALRAWTAPCLSRQGVFTDAAPAHCWRSGAALSCRDARVSCVLPRGGITCKRAGSKYTGGAHQRGASDCSGEGATGTSLSPIVTGT